MNELRALRELQQGSEEALQWLIERYTPYVDAVVRNIIGMSPADIEETDADVFVSLWRHADRVQPFALKSWLGATARNAAKNKLRALGQTLPLEEDMVLVAEGGPESEAERREQQRLVRRAVLDMDWPDREIFLRHYYYGQTVEAIAAKMGMNPSTVKTRLRRGREKLRGVLAPELSEQGGVPDAICKNF